MLARPGLRIIKGCGGGDTDSLVLQDHAVQAQDW
jgi:hypothetical protein